MFPYIQQIQVKNCYTYQDFVIPEKPLKEFRHIIITGKNGSGKTTILESVSQLYSTLFQQPWNDKHSLSNVKTKVLPACPLDNVKTNSNNIHSHFRAHRKVNVDSVDTVTKESDFNQIIQKDNGLKDNQLISKFKQYLVNKKVYEAFDHMNKGEISSHSTLFFENLTTVFQEILGDSKLKLQFVHEKFEFYLHLGDGREITFNQLSAGFSAFISILMELFIKTDLIRKENSDFTLEPEGIVFIDEPETHAHISMQYQILPLLTALFPKIQFIAATHSPAVISSLDNAVVFDLSSMESESESLVGNSYSELMIKHFGLSINARSS